MSRIAARYVCLLFLLCFAIPGAGVAGNKAWADAGERARVADDGSLKVGFRRVQLQGVYIPFTDERVCDQRFRPVRCGAPAAVALRAKIQGFVFCDYLGRQQDGSYVAACAVRCNDRAFSCREDLGGWLISQGWAVATRDAPFDYVVRERVAREQGRGIWGTSAGRIVR